MSVGRRRGSDVPTSSDLWASDGTQGVEWRCLVPGADVRVVTSGGRAIEAHSSVLAATSPVLEAMLFNRPPKRYHDGSVILLIPGVPCDAVLAFLRCLYRGKIMASPQPQDCGTTGTVSSSKHAVHLLVLSHAMRVAWLKRAAVSCLASALRPEDVVDLLQLARLCDAPGLKVRCLNYVRRHREDVEATEGWRFLRRCDPRMEAEVTRFVKEAERREERRRKRREENRAYVELGVAVECLHHILRQGCGGVGPTDDAKLQQQQQQQHLEDLDAAACCRWSQTCQGLKALIRHYATCQQRTKRKDADSLVTGGGGGCGRCGRMVQLLRLHAAISFELDHPMPPPLSSVCVSKSGDDDSGTIKWQLLARKVVCANLMSTLTLPKGQRESPIHCRPREHNKPWKNQGAVAA